MFHGCGSFNGAWCNNKHHSVCIFLFCHFTLTNVSVCVHYAVYTLLFNLCFFAHFAHSIKLALSFCEIQIAGITSLHERRRKQKRNQIKHSVCVCVQLHGCKNNEPERTSEREREREYGKGASLFCVCCYAYEKKTRGAHNGEQRPVSYGKENIWTK